jgi:hypothetical protein
MASNCLQALLVGLPRPFNHGCHTVPNFIAYVGCMIRPLKFAGRLGITGIEFVSDESNTIFDDFDLLARIGAVVGGRSPER